MVWSWDDTIEKDGSVQERKSSVIVSRLHSFNIVNGSLIWFSSGPAQSISNIYAGGLHPLTFFGRRRDHDGHRPTYTESRMEVK